MTRIFMALIFIFTFSFAKVEPFEARNISSSVSWLIIGADGKNISKYMAQIVIESPKLFFKLVKVEAEER